jgi:hypothetical protein
MQNGIPAILLPKMLASYTLHPSMPLKFLIELLTAHIVHRLSITFVHLPPRAQDRNCALIAEEACIYILEKLSIKNTDGSLILTNDV